MATLRPGDTAPDFQADSTEGPISFHAWLCVGCDVLFSHPADHTPVCTTEPGMTAWLRSEFVRRNVKVDDARYPKGIRRVKPYLRFVEQPEG